MFKTWWFYFAQPLKGYLEDVPDMKDKNIFVMHGRLDAVIPILGGVDGWNQWIYESENSMLEKWAKT